MYTKQQIQNFKKQLQNIVKNNPFSYFNILKKQKYKNLLNFINQITPKLQNQKYKLSTKIYWILNNITDFPICPICKKQYGIDQNLNITRGYNQTCSIRCSSINSKQKVKKTCLQKYGVDNPAKAEIIKEKSKNICIQKYGSQYVNQFTNKELNQKYKQICLQKYGVDNPNKSIEVKTKFKNTCLQKYGVDNPSKSIEVKTKFKNTCLQKYGVTNPNKIKKIRDKIKQTCLQKYGVEVSTQCDEIKNKVKQTCLQRYGVLAPMQNDLIKQKNKLVKATKHYKNFVQNQIIPLFNLDLYLNNKQNLLYEYTWKCNKCNTVFKSPININWYRYKRNYARCLNCYPYIDKCGNSNEENEVYEFIKNLISYNIIKNQREVIFPLELDIYIPNKKLAFQFDGLFYHSEINKPNNNYHLIKTKKCLEKDIQLIHIFENQWLFKQNIVKSRIKNLFGIYDKIIYARKCSIKEVNNKDTQIFLNENHLQGFIKSKFNIGLYYQNKLISLMTFGKSRYNKNYQYQLLRFCNLLGYHIPGAASKLLKYFQKTYSPKSIISYADRRWSNGHLYEKIGFNLLHISAPDYWYWKKDQFSHRSKYQKHKLKDPQNFKFDNNLTEAQNILNNGYHRIFDCKNLVYIKQYNNI